MRAASDKVRTLDALLRAVAAARARGERIAFTNGCFDLLHVGHVYSLEWARRQADRLVVAVNSDSSVRVLKGEDRPVVPEAERALVVSALASVDWVTIFSEETPESVIRAVRPDVMVKGAEYASRAAELPGAAFVESYGGHVALCPMFPGSSSTALRAKLLK